MGLGVTKAIKAGIDQANEDSKMNGNTDLASYEKTSPQISSANTAREVQGPATMTEKARWRGRFNAGR